MYIERDMVCRVEGFLDALGVAATRSGDHEIKAMYDGVICAIQAIGLEVTLEGDRHKVREGERG